MTVLHIGCQPCARMKDIKFFAIFVGTVVTILGALASGIVLGIFLMFTHPMQDMLAKGAPVTDIVVAMEKLMTQSISMNLASLGLGGFFCLVGGFVTGWIAKTSVVKNALIMSIISGLLGLLFITFYSAWYEVVCWLFTIGPAMAGGYLASVFIRPRPSTRT